MRGRRRRSEQISEQMRREAISTQAPENGETHPNTVEITPQMQRDIEMFQSRLVELPIIGEIDLHDALIGAGVGIAGFALLMSESGSSLSTSSRSRSSSGSDGDLPDPGDFDSWPEFAGAVRSAGSDFETASELWKNE